jgi:signal transduction histidine kinase
MLLMDKKKLKLLGKKGDEYLKRIYQGSRSMSELIDAMLNASRLELKTFVAEPKPCDIQKISREIIESITPLIKKKKIRLTEEYDETLPKSILLDEKMMTMILQNLLSNAVKYTPVGGEVSIKINKKQEDFVVEIKDNGIGIPASQIKKIGTKMFRADNVKKIDTSGTGLGLYIVKTILEEVGGCLRFVTQEGKGTIFFVTIPLSGMKAAKNNGKS